RGLGRLIPGCRSLAALQEALQARHHMRPAAADLLENLAPCRKLVIDEFRSRLCAHWIFSGQRRVVSSDSPVSSMLLRLDRIAGQPLDTAAINFDGPARGGSDISCVSMSLTMSPCCSS